MEFTDHTPDSCNLGICGNLFLDENSTNKQAPLICAPYWYTKQYESPMCPLGATETQAVDRRAAFQGFRKPSGGNWSGALVPYWWLRCLQVCGHVYVHLTLAYLTWSSMRAHIFEFCRPGAYPMNCYIWCLYSMSIWYSHLWLTYPEHKELNLKCMK